MFSCSRQRRWKSASSHAPGIAAKAIAILFIASILAGCGDKKSETSRATKSDSAYRDSAAKTTTTSEPKSSAGDAQSIDPVRFAADNATSGSNAPKVSDRKIIYTAELALVTGDFDKTEAGFNALLVQHRGYLAEGSVDRTSGARRTARWVARVPNTAFAGFLDQISALGVAESRRQHAEEVTEEFIDLQSRIATTKRLEERILKLLDERAGSIQQTIEVERELTRVRTEVERMEGRLRYLGDRTDLATITITVREEQKYQDPETPEFAVRVEKSWYNSLMSLRETGERATISAVSAAPWLILCAVFAVPMAIIARRKWRRRYRSNSIEH